jgi:hypothetical protein
MPRRWKEVVRLHFKGERFRDHALDLSALTELSQFQKMIAETAKARWRAANPGERLPPHFDARTRVCLRRIEDGSATVPLEVEEPEQHTFLESEPEAAIALAYEVFAAVERDAPLPEGFPRALIPEYAKWGQHLAEDEEVQFEPPQKTPIRVTAQHGARLAAFAETSHESSVEEIGEVLEADVRQKKFQLWIDGKTGVPVAFSDAQENEVTTALKEHRRVRMQVKGRAEVSHQGKLLRFNEVESLKIVQIGEGSFDPSSRPVEEILTELAQEVPHEEWDKLPADLTDHLDHYLYGTPTE